MRRVEKDQIGLQTFPRKLTMVLTVVVKVAVEVGMEVVKVVMVVVAAQVAVKVALAGVPHACLVSACAPTPAWWVGR